MTARWEKTSQQPKQAFFAAKRGDALIDQRVIDGFNVKFYGNLMCLTYQFRRATERSVRRRIRRRNRSTDHRYRRFPQKEYKKITGNSISLTEEGEVDVFVQNSSRVRTWVQAKKHFKVGGLSEDMNDDNSGSTNPVEANWKSFLDQGGWNGKGGSRPDNDTRPKSKND